MNVRNIALKAKINVEGQYAVVVQGKCMEPLLFAGDKVVLSHFDKLEIGDMYLFELPNGNLAVHRLIAKEKEFLFLKGDRSKCCEKVVYENFLGEVKWISFKEWDMSIEWNKYQRQKWLWSLLSRNMLQTRKGKRISKSILIFLSAICRTKFLIWAKFTIIIKKYKKPALVACATDNSVIFIYK